MRWLPLAAAVAVTLGGACGVFSLDEVVPVSDGGAEGARPGTDAAEDSPRSPDASADAPRLDDGASDALDAGVPCDGAASCACPPATLIATYAPPNHGTPLPRSLVVGAGRATWLDGTYTAWVFQSPLLGDGGTAQQLPLDNKYWIQAGDFTLSPGAMYFAVYDQTTTPPSWDLARAGYDAAADDTLLPGLVSAPSDLAATATSVVWTDTSAELCSMGLDGSIRPGDSGCGGAAFSPGQAGADGGNHALVSAKGIWLAVRDNGKLLRIPLTGGPGTVVATLSPGVSRALVGDDNAVFWSEAPKNAEAGIVYGESSQGGDAAVLATVPAIAGLASDSTQVYVLSGPVEGPNRVVAVARTGGPLSLLACPTAASAIAVDAQYVYWVNILGQLWRAPKLAAPSGD